MNLTREQKEAFLKAFLGGESIDPNILEIIRSKRLNKKLASMSSEEISESLNKLVRKRMEEHRKK